VKNIWPKVKRENGRSQPQNVSVYVLVSGVGVGGKPCQKETGKIRLFWPPLFRSGSNKFVGPPGGRGRSRVPDGEPN